MTTEYIVQFFERQPFIPFTLVLVDGREFHVRHPEVAMIGRSVLAVHYFHPTRQTEVIDVNMIVSIRTIYPALIEIPPDGAGADETNNDEGE